MVHGVEDRPIMGLGISRGVPLSPNPSPPKPLTPGRLESNFLSVNQISYQLIPIEYSLDQNIMQKEENITAIINFA